MLYITVHLYGKTGASGEFKAYEIKALNIFKKYGGEVILAYTPLRKKDHSDSPDEIQILKIASQIEFDKFLSAPERIAMSLERDSVIKKTEVFLSDEIIEY